VLPLNQNKGDSSRAIAAAFCRKQPVGDDIAYNNPAASEINGSAVHLLSSIIDADESGQQLSTLTAQA
jgi:hypothetical protein